MKTKVEHPVIGVLFILFFLFIIIFCVYKIAPTCKSKDTVYMPDSATISDNLDHLADPDILMEESPFDTPYSLWRITGRPDSVLIETDSGLYYWKPDRSMNIVNNERTILHD